MDGAGTAVAVSHAKETTTMDDKSKANGQDRQRINVNEEYEVRDWAKSFGVAPDEIKKAVKSVGDRADAVRKYLAERR
jgi:hypothetical protein